MTSPPFGHPLHPASEARLYHEHLIAGRSPCSVCGTSQPEKHARPFEDLVVEHMPRLKAWLHVPEAGESDLITFLSCGNPVSTRLRFPDLSWFELAEMLRKAGTPTVAMQTGWEKRIRFRTQKPETTPVWDLGEPGKIKGTSTVLCAHGHLLHARRNSESGWVSEAVARCEMSLRILQHLRSLKSPSTSHNFVGRPAEARAGVEKEAMKRLGLSGGRPPAIALSGDVVLDVLTGALPSKDVDPRISATGRQLAIAASLLHLPRMGYGFRLYERKNSTIGDEWPKHDGELYVLSPAGELEVRQGSGFSRLVRTDSADRPYWVQDILALGDGGRYQDPGWPGLR